MGNLKKRLFNRARSEGRRQEEKSGARGEELPEKLRPHGSSLAHDGRLGEMVGRRLLQPRVLEVHIVRVQEAPGLHLPGDGAGRCHQLLLPLQAPLVLAHIHLGGQI